MTYQLKILTTALFSVVMLRRSLLPRQWLALLMLAFGVVIVQLANTGAESKVSCMLCLPLYLVGQVPEHPQNRMMGFAAATAACFSSGFAGVYFERILKGTPVSLWLRQVSA